MKISEHFDVREFVTPEIWAQFKEASKWFVRPEVVALAEFTRNHFGKPLMINNWHAGGDLKQRGTRNPWTETGGKLSQHKFMNAFDFNVGNLTDDEVFDEIMKNEKKFMAAGLTTLEDKKITVGWTHADTRWTGLDKILIVKP